MSQPPLPVLVHPDLSGISLDLSEVHIRPGRPSITPSRLHHLLHHSELSGYSGIIVVDARYKYEYEGGHINGAINITTNEDLRNLYYRYKDSNVVIVFHCEFSSMRGPRVYDLFHGYDRDQNSYPSLSYPNVFILEGGYKAFYQQYSEDCQGDYIAMQTQKYVANGSLRACYQKYNEEFGTHGYFKKKMESLPIFL